MLHCNFDFILLILNCGTPTGNLFSYSLSLTLCCCMCMYCAYKLFMLWVLLVSISLREYLVPLYCLLASYLTVPFYLSPHYVGVTLSSLLLVFLLAAFLQCLSNSCVYLRFWEKNWWLHIMMINVTLARKDCIIHWKQNIGFLWCILVY